LEIGDDTARFARESRRVISLGVGQVPEKRIAALELQAVRKSFVDDGREGVIVAPPSVRLDLHQSPQRIEQQRTAGLVPGSIRRKLVRVTLPAQLVPVASVVRQSQTGAESEISFDRQVPLVDCRVLEMDIPSLLEELRSG